MATMAQRAQALGDAYVNGVATAAQINTLGEALAWQVGMLTEYQAMTQGEKAEFFVTRTITNAKALVRTYKENTKSTTAIDDARTETNNEFPTIP